MRAVGRILALAAALAAAVVVNNHFGIVRLAQANPDTWDGGRGPEAMKLTLGVFGGGAAVMALVAVLAIVAALVGGRRPRSGFWLLLIPGILGLVAAAAATGAWVAFQPFGERFLAYIAVPLAVPSLAALIAGLFMRAYGGSAAAARVAAGAVTSAGRASLLLLPVLAVLCVALLLALPASGFAFSIPDRDPATLEEAAQMVRSMQESGVTDDFTARWLSGVIDRRITNVNSLERMSIGGNWIPWPLQSESAADKAFGEWRDRNDFDHAGTATWAWDNGLGQCSECACTAYTVLTRAGVTGSVRILTAPNHEFVVWGMRPGADPNDPMTWGDDARVVDGWLGRVLSPEAVRTSPYFQGGYTSSSVFGIGPPSEPRPLSDSTRLYDPRATAWRVNRQGQASAGGGSGSPGGDAATGGSGIGETPSPVGEVPGPAGETPGADGGAVAAIADDVQPQSQRYEGEVTVLNTPPLPVYRLADSHVEVVVIEGSVSVTVEFTLVAVLKWEGQNHLCTATMYRKYQGQGSGTNPVSMELRLVDYSDALEGPDCQGVTATRVDSQPLTGTFLEDGSFSGTIRNAWKITATKVPEGGSE